MPFVWIGMFFLSLQVGLWIAEAGAFLQAAAEKLGGPGIMLIALCDSSFLSFPEGNDLLIVILSIGSTWKGMAYYVAMTVLGSLLGCSILYIAGRNGGNPLLRKKFSQKSIENAESKFKKYGVLSIIVPSILPPPFPFKLFVLIAGVFRFSAGKFLAAVTVGRIIRYTIWGVLGVLYGNSVSNYLQKNLEGVGVFFLTVFLATTGIVLFYYLRNPRPDSF
jgi:membrane protein DedA with SNARE-associated domain